MSGAGDIRNLQSSGSAVNPDECLHCFCTGDAGGNLKCCKCGSILLVTPVLEKAAGDEDCPLGRGFAGK